MQCNIRAFIITSLSLFFVASCGAKINDNSNVELSSIAFKIDVPADENILFRRSLLKQITTQQIRDKAIALSPNIEGNVDYEVVIFGKCKGAIEEILPLIKEAAPKDAFRNRMIDAYMKTSKCTIYDANKPVEVMLK